MMRNWRRTPGRRTTAAVLASAVAATGVVYAGLHTGSSATHDSPPPQAKPITEGAALAEAARTGANVEITTARTASSTTWARPDGQMAKQLFSSPVRTKVDGEWRSIDTGLRRTKSGWEPKATSTHLVFSAGAKASRQERTSRAGVQRISLLKGAATGADTATPLVAITVGGHTVQLTWPGAVPTPIIDGSRALYPEIFPGADLVLTADDDGFAQLIVLKNRQAAADPRAQQLSYGLASPDLSFRLDPSSGILGVEDEDGNEVANSPTPLMWDSSGQPATTDSPVGATAQPSASESPNPTDSPTTDESSGPATDLPPDSDEQADPYGETLPPATDGPVPTVSSAPDPTAPGEPSPAPSQSGSAATLSLPSLDGPSPDSLGTLVETDLSGANWILTPDQDFLNDPAVQYPVFVDPSVKKHTQNWTTAYNRFPKSTFYNGRGFNKGGTHEARVGFESDTWGTSRSFFNISFDKGLKGAKLTSAKLRVLETYSWSCQDRSMSVHITGAINSRTNWSNAPKLTDGNKLSTKSFAHGYKSGCHDAYETFDVRSGAQKRADEGAESITFGMRARDENAQYAWKKFQSDGDNAPVLEIVYNRRPDAPTALDLNPDGKCTTTEPYTRMGSGSVSFTAKASDKDKNLDFLDVDLWPTGKWATTGDLLGATGKALAGGDTDTALRTTPLFPTTKLTNNTVYSWRVRAVDDAGASSTYSPSGTPCRFVLDTAAPRPPKVSSTVFPDADGNENGFGNEAEDSNWSAVKFGTAGSFTVRSLDTDVVRYEYGYGQAAYPFSLARTAGTAATVSATIANAKPPAAGPNVLYVRTVDGAGNVSQPTKYFFYVSPRDLADTPGDFTGDKLPDLMAVTAGGNLALYASQASNDLSKPTGDLDYSASAAYQDNPAKDPNGDDKPPYVAAPPGYFKGALITHNGDIYRGDGLQDLVVRLGGKLWVYPSDGYGAVNINERREILLPTGAPAPSTFTQIVAAGDATGDGRTDFFATVGDALWAFTGYNGATIEKATLLSSTAWHDRVIVTAQDISGDHITDLVYRDDASDDLSLRTGIASATGGVNLASLNSGLTSQGGADTKYTSTGWGSSTVYQLMGTPDVTGDGIPDIWAIRTADGTVRLYPGGKATLSSSWTEIVTTNNYWNVRISIG
ncbi:DNRLRE domain-containing protein [Streptomyces sp. NPDC048428]|uniref:DNRLRE domain-containing protein n=1 Tax=Streptomyces sp. NPDC048428 TaxID=3154503 RepID=UPI003411FA8A